MRQKRPVPWKLICERVLLLLPGLLAGFFRWLRGHKKQRLRTDGNALLVFPADPVKAFLALPLLDWWLPALLRQTHAANLPEAASGHPAIAKTVDLPNNLIALWWFLLLNRYKTVILLEPQRYRRTSFVLWAAGVRFRAALTVTDRNPFLNYRYPFNEGSVHYSHQLRAFFEDITLQKTEVLPPIEQRPDDATTRRALKMITELELGRFIIVLPAETNLPSWTTERYADLVGSQKLTVLLTATNETEFKKGQAILAAANRLYPNREHEILLTGVLEPNFITALAQRAEAIVTEDSLTAHQMAAAGARVIVLFGPRNERIYAPFSNKVRLVTATIACRPCLREQEPFICDNSEFHGCLKQIATAQVQAVLDTIIDRKPAKVNARGDYP